jgi:TPR repeat protein
MLRERPDSPQDLTEAFDLARAAADAGQPAAMNMVGVMLRDGIGTARDETGAAEWFRRAAVLRNPYSLAHLGEMYWSGRGGVERNRTEAVKLFRKSAWFENPWGRFYLARALETGEGVERNQAEAIALYRLVAAADGDAGAQKRAQEALTRLNPVARP